jgi:tetratricopeptide (TPR) repeat protein
MLTPHQALTLGLRHHQAGDLATAEQLYRQVLQVEPRHPTALQQLGLIALQQGRNDAAIDLLTESLRVNPSSPAAHFHLGRALRAQGRLEEGVVSYRQSLRLNAGSAAAHNNLGDALLELERWDEAAAALREAVRLKPDFPEAHNNLGTALSKQGRFEEAEAHCREALRLRPDYFPAASNLGILCRDQGKLEEAAAWLGRALHARPDCFPAWHNLGNALTEQGKLEEALACLTRAVRLKPDNAEAHRDRGMILLLQGDWEQGWPEYEWRHRCRESLPPPPGLPVWDGSPLAGRTILLLDEQGLGDNIQFARYVPLVKAQGGTVVLVCQPALARLFAGCPGVDRVVARGSDGPGPADVYVPLLNLSGIYRTTATTVPGGVPHFSIDPGLVETWRQELGDLPGFKVGISWQGNPRYGRDRGRSLPLAHFAPVAEVPGARLFSLQKNVGSEQLPSFAERFGVVDLGPRLADPVDTAAVMRNLDLVITSDTMVAHLAGALGVPVWVALGRVADWRWLLDREDSPWYPTMRLFRQKAGGDWADVFARAAAELRGLVAERGIHPSAPPAVPAARS